MIWSYTLCANWLDGLCSHEKKENHLDQDPNSWKRLACSKTQLIGIKRMIKWRHAHLEELDQLVDKALKFYHDEACQRHKQPLPCDLCKVEFERLEQGKGW